MDILICADEFIFGKCSYAQVQYLRQASDTHKDVTQFLFNKGLRVQYRFAKDLVRDDLNDNSFYELTTFSPSSTSMRTKKL
jgi:hypothetical protein